MTVCLAMKYDKGVLLAADQLAVISYDRGGDVSKITKIRENLLIAFTGNLSTAQYFTKKVRQDLLSADNTLINYINEKFKSEKPEEGKKGSLLEKYLHLSGKDGLLQIVDDGKWQVRLTGNKIAQDFEKPATIEGSILFETVGNEILMNVESMLSVLQSAILRSQTRDTAYLAVGFDRSGFNLYTMDNNGAILPSEGIYAIGSSQKYALGRCSACYQKGLSLENALKLALFSLYNANNFDVGVENKFMVAYLQLENNNIKATKVSQKDISDYLARAGTLQKEIRNLFK